MFWRLTQGDSDQRMLGFKQIFDYNSDLLKGLAVLKQVEDDVQVDKRGCSLEEMIRMPSLTP
jgi:hypothetical protein